MMNEKVWLINEIGMNEEWKSMNYKLNKHEWRMKSMNDERKSYKWRMKKYEWWMKKL